MTAKKQNRDPNKPVDRSAEYERRKVKRLAKKLAAEKLAAEGAALPKSEGDESLSEDSEMVRAQLKLLNDRTRDVPTDADRDINFAYRHMANPDVTPLMAPTTSAWSWYKYARSDQKKFLEICAKREDAKAKAAGTVTSQRMEDDKRQQFAILDRIEKQLMLDIKSIVADLMGKFPEDTLLECRKYSDEWKAFHEKYPCETCNPQRSN